MSGYFISLAVFLPLIAALLMAFTPRSWKVHGWINLLVSLAVLIVACVLFIQFPEGSSDFHWIEKVPWIEAFGVEYHVGLDGISLTLFALTAFLGFLTSVFVLKHPKYSSKEFLMASLVLLSSMLGTFAALDIFLFYVFWEAMLIPMYYLIGRFGGVERRYATMKFFIYTMAGSVLMLIGIIWLYVLHIEQSGFKTTSLLALYQLQLDTDTQTILFVLFSMAFLIKIPIFPFHTWLPDAHVEAPTPGSIILAGVLLKMGGYGLIRFVLPLFPTASMMFAPWIAALGVVGIIYGAYVAWAQTDMKKLIAYSSVSHMGFVVLGIFSLKTVAMSGALFQMIAHGISTGAMFLLIGILYDRTHSREIRDYGGMALIMPRYTTVFMVITLASIGLPGLCGFVGEFLILSGSFASSALVHPEIMVGISTLGIILGAAYMLSLYERVFLGGTVLEKNKSVPDINLREALIVLLPLLLAIWLGVTPNILLEKIEAPLQKIQQVLGE